MTIYEYITQASYPITIKGVIDDIIDGTITIRDARSGYKIIMPDNPKDVEKEMHTFLFEGEELSDDEHTMYVL